MLCFAYISNTVYVLSEIQPNKRDLDQINCNIWKLHNEFSILYHAPKQEERQHIFLEQLSHSSSLKLSACGWPAWK